MNVTDSKLNIEEIESYLFLEMGDDQRSAFEQELFENDEFFFDVEEHENHLVDLYVRAKLPPDTTQRFERSLADLPARREKVANAEALKRFIEDERPAVAVAVSTQIIRERLGQKLVKLFSFGSPAAALTLAALAVVFMSATILLVSDNRQKNGELARLREERSGTASELESAREEFDREHQTVGDLSEENEAQRDEIAKLENRLKERQSQELAPRPTATPRSPTTSVNLPPPDKGGRDIPVTMGHGTERVVIRIPLPASIQAGMRFVVELNGRVVARGLPIRVSGGEKSVHVTVDADELRDGPNLLRVLDDAGGEVTKYTFNKKKD